MKFFKHLCSCLLFSFLLCGCASWEKTLPLVNASHIEYHRTNPGSNVEIVADNLHVTETEVTADSVSVETTYPFVGHVQVTIKDYKRERAAH